MQRYAKTSTNPHSVTKTPRHKQAWVTKAYTVTYTHPSTNPYSTSLWDTPHPLKATHFTPSLIGIHVCSSEFGRAKGWTEPQQR